MTNQSETFGRLLRGAINSIAAYEGKTAVAVEEELGRAVGLSSAAIQRYKAGTLPPEARTVQILAESAIQRGYLGRAWLQRFLQAAQFRLAADLIARLIGDAWASTILPSGTLAFLFTDIAGSTQHWEHERMAMEQALIRHDNLMRQAIELSGGQVFKTVGDAFYAVFATTPNALDGAIAAQRAIRDEPWPTSSPIQVRMAIHVGAVQPRDGDYFGAPLNRVARLCAAGHGGQVLLSAAAWELARDQLPAEVMLRELGERRLKDLGRPERIFQVVTPDLPAEFPRLNALDRYRHNLPPQATILIGRERETHAVCDLLRAPETRLLTLTGPGGVGKTRLALNIAAELLDTYLDGVWFVPLAAVREPQALMEQIATILGVPGNDDRPVEEQVHAFLRHKTLLLVFDNFEQIVNAASLVSELLADAIGVQALVTSRTVLHLYGEREFVVPPLELPDPQRPSAPDRLAQYDALRLFIERAQAVRPDFVVTNESAPVIAEICARLDGLPLAIELAAARSRLFAPRALLARLDRRLSVLTGGARDLPARHQTLRDTIAWSYDMLDIAEQTLFARTGVFGGGWTLEAAEQVCGNRTTNEAPALAISLPTDEIARVLESLTGKSLIRMDEGPDGEARFTMLETLREYAIECLVQSREEQSLRDRHLRYYTQLAEDAEPYLRGEAQLNWLVRLSAEDANLEAALAWAAALTSDAPWRAELGLRLANACWYRWLLGGRVARALAWLDAPWSANPNHPPTLRARALVHAAAIAQWSFNQGRWSELTTRALELAKSSNDPYPLALALASRALAFEDYTPLDAEWEAAAAAAQSTGDSWVIALVKASAAYMRWYRPEDQLRQRTALTAARVQAQQVGDRRLLALIDHMLGLTLRASDPTWAEELFTEQLALHESLGDWQGVSLALWGLGLTARGLGDLSSAQAYFERRLAAANTIGNPTGIARCRYELGTLALSRAEYALAHAHLQGCRDELVQAGDPDNDAVAMAILHLAAAAHEQGEPQAMALLAEVGEFAKRTRRAWIAASVEGTQAAWELAAGRPEAAVARLESLLAFSQAQGHRWSQAGLLIDLGTAATQRGDNAQATALLGESLIIAREIQDVPTIARALMQMGQARLAGTDHAGASRDLGEALSLLQRMGARRQVAQALEVCAGVAMAVGAAEQAARLGGAAEALRDTIGAPRWPVEQASYAGWAAAARLSMGDGRFDTAWAAGRQLTLDQAVVESTQV